VLLNQSLTLFGIHWVETIWHGVPRAEITKLVTAVPPLMPDNLDPFVTLAMITPPGREGITDLRIERLLGQIPRSGDRQVELTKRHCSMDRSGFSVRADRGQHSSARSRFRSMRHFEKLQTCHLTKTEFREDERNLLAETPHRCQGFHRLFD